MADTQRSAQSSGATAAAATGDGKGFPGAGEAFASRSLDDSSLPVNFHGNLASAHNDEELLSLLQRAKTSKRPVSPELSLLTSRLVHEICEVVRFVFMMHLVLGLILDHLRFEEFRED
jgi:hypothetical protein